MNKVGKVLQWTWQHISTDTKTNMTNMVQEPMDLII